ncbi:hypothetical protein INR49_017356 [Caranx melampygus]|nr:hypothetical protein INR49_017356 [Caranx melampygus]
MHSLASALHPKHPISSHTWPFASNLRKTETHNLQSLHTILSTGSPLKPQSYDYVYRCIKSNVLLGSISGQWPTQDPVRMQKTKFQLPPGSQLKLNKEPGRKRSGENECKEQKDKRERERGRGKER